jgi:hypothetical protein
MQVDQIPFAGRHHQAADQLEDVARKNGAAVALAHRCR